jgi:hypothetical protein
MSDSAERKKAYMRDYYIRHKDDPEYVARKKEISKRNYHYTRKTIDCPRCQMRHRPDFPDCLVLKEGQKAMLAAKIIQQVEVLRNEASES